MRSSASSTRLRLIIIVLAIVGSAAPAMTADPVVLYETVIPGYFLSSGHRMAAAADGRVIVAAGFQGHQNDILVVCLDAQGDIDWDTTIEGDAIDIATAVELDHSGDVVLVGWTDSDDFPTTPDGLYPDRVAHREAFVLKLSSADGSILYGTYLGGSHTEQAEDVTIAEDGSIYVAGSTDSPDFPTVNPAQVSLANPPYQFSDAFVARISADGSTLLNSTYLGGERDDVAREVVVGANGRIFVAGNTDSTSLPAAGGLQPTFGGGESDLFVSVLAPGGAAIQRSTYLGGEDWDHLYGAAVGSDGSVYLAGMTASLSFPTTSAAAYPDFIGAPGGCEIPFGADRNCWDGFVARLDQDLDSQIFGTYLGGSLDDEIRDLAVDVQGNARVAGYTLSSDFPNSVGISGPAMFVAQLDAEGAEFDYVLGIDAAGSTNAGHGVALGILGETTFATGARNVPAEVYVTHLSDPMMLFCDGFEAGAATTWSGP